MGALSFVDRSPHPFDRAELEILEFMARHCCARLRGAPRIVDDSGLLGRRAFEVILGA